MSLESWRVVGIVPGIGRAPLEKLEADEANFGADINEPRFEVGARPADGRRASFAPMGGQTLGHPSYRTAVTSIPATAAAITAVASHPVKRRTPVTVNCPMTFVLAERSIIRTIIGTATTPLMTADQNSAWIGLNDVKFNATPIKVAIAKVA
jgi:hypothetical protein